MVSASRKELSTKVSAKEKNFSISWNERFVKKYVSTRQMKILWFLLARKSVSTTWNEAFVEKYVSTIQQNCFFWEKNRKWFQLAKKYFSV